MKNIRRIASLIVALALVLSLFTFASAENSKTVTFHLNVRDNFMWALYSVEVFLDDQYIITIDQGDLYTFGALLSDGYHKLSFRPAYGSGYEFIGTRNWYLNNLSDGTVISATLQTREFQQISINDPMINNTKISVYNQNLAGTIQGYIIKLL